MHPDRPHTGRFARPFVKILRTVRSLEGDLTDRIALRLADLAIRRRWWMILGTLVLVVAAASGAGHLRFANNYRVFFSPENPELVAFDSLQETYTKSDNILFVLLPAEGDVFTASTLSAVEWLTTEAAA